MDREKESKKPCRILVGVWWRRVFAPSWTKVKKKLATDRNFAFIPAAKRLPMQSNCRHSRFMWRKKLIIRGIFDRQRDILDVQKLFPFLSLVERTLDFKASGTCFLIITVSLECCRLFVRNLVTLRRSNWSVIIMAAWWNWMLFLLMMPLVVWTCMGKDTKICPSLY